MALYNIDKDKDFYEIFSLSSYICYLDCRSIRVPLSIPTELITNIPELQVTIDYWEKECMDNPESSRHYYLGKMLDEIRGLKY